MAAELDEPNFLIEFFKVQEEGVETETVEGLGVINHLEVTDENPENSVPVDLVSTVCELEPELEIGILKLYHCMYLIYVQL